MAALNYATEYSRALSQAFPYVLYFGALYSTPNNGRYRWINAKTIEIPSISTTGRVDADRDTIATAARNYNNAWEPKVLTNERKWSTLVHPKDIDQTGMVTTIQNITQVYNQEQKFPEMDAYTISKIYADWTGQSKTADTVVPSELMKTLYEFTTGWSVASAAKQINMLLIHPLAVITPVSYTFAQLDQPSALSEGKYVYYEESFEDVFILNKKADAIQINMEASA